MQVSAQTIHNQIKILFSSHSHLRVSVGSRVHAQDGHDESQARREGEIGDEALDPGQVANMEVVGRKNGAGLFGHVGLENEEKKMRKWKFRGDECCVGRLADL